MVPLMKPVFEGQETREAARNISVFFANAKTLAIQKNRPVGVWIERASSQLIDPTFPISDNNPSNPNNNIPAERAFASYRLFIAEQPESYTGDTQDAQMALRMDAHQTEYSHLPEPIGVLHQKLRYSQTQTRERDPRRRTAD